MGVGVDRLVDWLAKVIDKALDDEPAMKAAVKKGVKGVGDTYALARQLMAEDPPSDLMVSSKVDMSIADTMGAEDGEEVDTTQGVDAAKMAVKMVAKMILEGLAGKAATLLKGGKLKGSKLLEQIGGISICHPFLGAISGKTINAAAKTGLLPGSEWQMAMAQQGCNTIGVRETNPDGKDLSCERLDIERAIHAPAIAVPSMSPRPFPCHRPTPPFV